MRYLLLTTIALLPGLPAQAPATDKARAAIESWERGEVRGVVREKEAVETIVEAGTVAIRMLAARLYGSEAPKERARLLGLTDRLAVRWLGVVEKSRMVYAGQYSVLAPLMPSIGQSYLTLILETPVDFASTERWKAVAAVRDLYPKGPGRDVMDRFEDMAKDELEPADLREKLKFALAQWGRRELMKDRIKALQKEANSEDDEIAVLALRSLADLYYGVRDYSAAAVTSREFITRAEKSEAYLVPVHYYNAACCMCLSGDRRTALEYLERCLALNGSDKIDSSMRLERRLFEGDPEIELARRDGKFAPMLERAFGKKPTSRRTDRDR